METSPRWCAMCLDSLGKSVPWVSLLQETSLERAALPSNLDPSTELQYRKAAG